MCLLKMKIIWIHGKNCTSSILKEQRNTCMTFTCLDIRHGQFSALLMVSLHLLPKQLFKKQTAYTQVQKLTHGSLSLNASLWFWLFWSTSSEKKKLAKERLIVFVLQLDSFFLLEQQFGSWSAYSVSKLLLVMKTWFIWHPILAQMTKALKTYSLRSQVILTILSGDTLFHSFSLLESSLLILSK